MKSTTKGFVYGYFLIMVFFFLFFWWARKEKDRKVKQTWITHGAGVETPQEAQSEEIELQPALQKTQVISTQDDLSLINGIGPKMAGILNENGINTFAQLANTDISTLKRILKEKNLAFTNPTSWAEQARLAAAGKLVG